jgi:hypothetical protein
LSSYLIGNYNERRDKNKSTDERSSTYVITPPPADISDETIIWYFLDSEDCFRVRNFLYTEFLVRVIRAYREFVKQYEKMHHIPFLGKEAREAFFAIFTEMYPQMLLTMLEREARESFDDYENSSQVPSEIWPKFDLVPKWPYVF